MSGYTQIINYTLEKNIQKCTYKNVCVFGINIYTNNILNLLHSYDIKTNCIFENDLSKHGKYWGIDVCAPHFLDNAIVLIASKHYGEMKKQLLDMGFDDGCIISLVNTRYQNWLEDDYTKSFCMLEMGKEKLANAMDNAEYIFLFPSKSIGDAYLPARVLNKFIIEDNNALAFVVSKGAKKILENIKGLRIEVVSPSLMLCLEKCYWVFYRELKKRVHYMHTTPHISRQIDIGSDIQAAFGYSFAEAFGKMILLSDKKPEHFDFDYNISRIKSVFEDNNLVPGKTILLAPTSNTMPELPLDFWERIAAKANELGFSVCTNIGSSTEKPIKNTAAARIDINDFKEFVAMAGYSIMARSGLCDIVGNISSNKIVIYADFSIGFNTFFSFNDLKKGNIDNNVEQFVVDDRNYLDTEYRICKLIEEWKENAN